MLIIPIIFVLFMCGVIAAAIASERMPFTHSFWMGALLGPIGVIIVATIVMAKATK